MARNDDDETPWTRLLLVTTIVLVAVALVIGGVVSVLALGAAKVSGIDDAAATATVKPSLYIPSDNPTVRVDPYPAPEGDPGAASPRRASRSPSASPSKKKSTTVSLQASPQKVSPGQRITLTGAYPRGEGAQLQVQRFENGAWTDFPVIARVRGRLFNTYITTSRVGATRFRMLDIASGSTSNVVRVRIG